MDDTKKISLLSEYISTNLKISVLVKDLTKNLNDLSDCLLTLSYIEKQSLFSDSNIDDFIRSVKKCKY